MEGLDKTCLKGTLTDLGLKYPESLADDMEGLFHRMYL